MNAKPFKKPNSTYFVIRDEDSGAYLSKDEIYKGQGLAVFRYTENIEEAMIVGSVEDAQSLIDRHTKHEEEYEKKRATWEARGEERPPRRVVCLMPGFTLDDAIIEINDNLRGHSADLGFRGVSEIMMKSVAGCWNRKLREADEVTHSGESGDHFANIKAPVGYGHGAQDLSPHDFTRVFYVGPPPPLSEYFMNDWFEPDDANAKRIWEITQRMNRA